MFSRYEIKPSKSKSALGMFVGVIFIIIGITQIVPQFGLFGVLWTLFAVGSTGYYIINFFSKNGVSAYQVDVQENIIPQKTSSEDLETKLRQLHRLKEDNIISEEEYQRKKDQLLNEKW